MVYVLAVAVTNMMKFHDLFACLLFFFFLLLAVTPATSTHHKDWKLIAEITGHEDFVKLAGYGEERLSSVLVMGSVLCNPCQGRKAELVSGANVAVRCRRGKIRIGIHGVTDEFGDFTIELPSEIHAWPKLERSCRVKVIQVPYNSTCYPSFSEQPTHMRLSSVGNGVRAFDVGTVWIKKKIGEGITCG